MEPTTPPRGQARESFAVLFGALWLVGSVVALVAEIAGWDGDEFVYDLIGGPLLVGFVATGVPWLVLFARELGRTRRRVLTTAAPWILAGVGALALVCATVGVQLLVS